MEEEGKSNRLTKKEFEEAVKKQQETEKRKKDRRKSGRDPSVKDIKKHLGKIMKFHCKRLNDEIPSIYPILGPVNLDSDDEGDGDSKRGTQSMKNTKGEFKRYYPT